MDHHVRLIVFNDSFRDLFFFDLFLVKHILYTYIYMYSISKSLSLLGLMRISPGGFGMPQNVPTSFTEAKWLVFGQEELVLF